MRCYLAHPVTDYGGSKRQKRAIKAIECRGWVVESPDKPWHQDGYKTGGMEYFLDVIRDCDALAFLAFPSGKIGAGVAQEIAAALTRGLRVYDISADFTPITMLPWDLLTVEETRAEIAAIRASDTSHDRGTE
jgi:hypothetical protein